MTSEQFKAKYNGPESEFAGKQRGFGSHVQTYLLNEGFEGDFAMRGVSTFARQISAKGRESCDTVALWSTTERKAGLVYTTDILSTNGAVAPLREGLKSIYCEWGFEIL